MYEKLHDITVTVNDLEEAMSFYDTLGFQVEQKSDTFARAYPTENSPYVSIVETDKVEGVERSVDVSSNPLGIDHFSLLVDNVDRVYDTLLERDIEFFLEPTKLRTDLKVAGVKDPGGSVIYIMRWLK